MGKGTELAKAYVQIIPSAEGMKGKIKQALDSEVKESGKKLGDSLGKEISDSVKPHVTGIKEKIKNDLGKGGEESGKESGNSFGKKMSDSVKSHITGIREKLKSALGKGGEESGKESGNSFGKKMLDSVKSHVTGIKEKLKSILGKGGEESGESFGSKFSGAIKNAIAAAGIGKAIAATINEGAALQQSIGGIETLFKDSANTMKQYAAVAYRTAGMSANEYMETVTGFSASLLQGLGGDTAKAAKIADMAMIDMSDNANKMGTDMGSIQNAYQGFAKQNYTMLDNLKLGYGGTKNEMQRLLKDAQKFSGIKYDINNLSDVYEAIHVVQEELDITGTTAKEASTTFSGSMAAMKAAAKNVLGKLALGEDIKPSLIGLVDTTFTFLNKNMIPMVWDILKGLPGMLKEALSLTANELLTADWAGIANAVITELGNSLSIASGEILGVDTSVIDSVCMSVTENLPNVLAKGVEVISTMANGMLGNLPKVILSAGKILGSLLDFIMQNFPSVLQSGVRLVGELARGMLNNIPAILSSSASVIANLLDKIGSHLPDLLASGIRLIGELAAGLIKAIPQVVGSIPKIISSIVKEFGNHDWKSIGSNIISGIARGITSGVGAIADAAREAAASALNAAKKFLKIKSPSKVMQDEVGRWIPEGIAEGILGNRKSVSEAMEELTKETTGTMQADLIVGIKQGQMNLSRAQFFGNNDAKSKGYTQNIHIYSPTELSASEIARQTRNATRNMILALG